MVNVHVMLFFVVAVTVVAVRFWKGSDFSYLVPIRSQEIGNISAKEQLTNIPVQPIPYFLVACWDHDTSSDCRWRTVQHMIFHC